MNQQQVGANFSVHNLLIPRRSTGVKNKLAMLFFAGNRTVVLQLQYEGKQRENVPNTGT